MARERERDGRGVREGREGVREGKKYEVNKRQRRHLFIFPTARTV